MDNLLDHSRAPHIFVPLGDANATSMRTGHWQPRRPHNAHTFPRLVGHAPRHREGLPDAAEAALELSSTRFGNTGLYSLLRYDLFHTLAVSSLELMSEELLKP
ncbi:hypothetical protein B0H11DRAFT_2259714 [Mycena galericulata]|nr:hypothetical protein B0H11DRAFT_2259714 [Mycena galericulata]